MGLRQKSSLKLLKYIFFVLFCMRLFSLSFYLVAMYLFSEPEMTRQIKISLQASSKELSHPSANACRKTPL
jgi:uncharacterized membrane protein SpoIIM required for sporulation